MAIIALVSAKGSPGVTTSALACALAWHRRLVVAECDPAGGSILAGYLGGQLDGPRGIGELAVGELRDGNLDTAFWSQLVDLDAPRRERLLLPGLVDPAQSGSVTRSGSASPTTSTPSTGAPPATTSWSTAVGYT